MRSDCDQSIPFLEASENLVEKNAAQDPIKQYDLDSSNVRRRPARSIIRRISKTQFLVRVLIVYMSTAKLLAASSAFGEGDALLE
jgi:hypothetical protein